METIEEILSLIKDEDLEQIAISYGINRYNHKITGELLFKGLMRLILQEKKTSLRMLEMMINQGFGTLQPLEEVSYSGLSKRLNKINPAYFTAIYHDLVQKLSPQLNQNEKNMVYRFDSTIINLSGRLIKDGLKLGGQSRDNQIKVSMGLKNQLPESIRFCTSQEESSEDIALVRAINEAKINKEDILLFDRGIQKAQTYEDFSSKDYKFITRVKEGRKHAVVERRTIKQSHQDGAIITEDLIVNLYETKGYKPLPCELRLIKLINKEGNHIWFLTNLMDLTPFEIATLYRRRWDIEVFFKFIKQHLGYKHFISHSLNGMKVYITMILITALIFLAYKIRNKLKGFKIALLQFSLALDKSFIKSIIILSGGNFDAVKHLLL